MDFSQFEDISAEDLQNFLSKARTKTAKVKSTNSPRAKRTIGKKGYAQVMDKDGYKYIPVQDTDHLKIIVKNFKKPKYRKNLYARIFWEQEKW
jgi:hypothetical protein